MPWLRVGDTSITHPIVLRALELEDADERTLWELFGFVTACATHAAAHKTDYIIELGTIRSLAGLSQADRLIQSAVECGYFTEVEGEDGRRAYKLVDDPELFHMRLKDDIDWERRQRNDTRNFTLTAPIRHRDGDACRWCGKVVFWGDQKSGRGATYDHLKPGTGAESPDDMVVSCRACNSSRKNEVMAWVGRKPLPAPKDPRYGKKTTVFLADNGIKVAEEAALDFPVKGRYENFKPVAVTPAPVDPNSVDPTAVEPETLAPAAAGPEGTAPGAVEPSDRQGMTPQEVESAYAEISSTPTWDEIEQWARKHPALVESSQRDNSWHPAYRLPEPAVEPEIPDPAGKGGKPVQGASRDKREGGLLHSESFAISRASDLDMPGRVGAGLVGRPGLPTDTADSSSSSGSSVPRKRRRRRRR